MRDLPHRRNNNSQPEDKHAKIMSEYDAFLDHFNIVNKEKGRKFKLIFSHFLGDTFLNVTKYVGTFCGLKIGRVDKGGYLRLPSDHQRRRRFHSI